MSSSSKRQKMVLSGQKFEHIVAFHLNSSFEYPILFNREFYDMDSKRKRECDLLFITPFKIYSVECKNYSGYIAGRLFDEKWRFASSGRKNKVNNPYLSNKRRIRLLRGKFYGNNYNPPEIENIIVVPDSCNIHVTYKNIYNLSDFLNLVRIDSVTNKSIYKVDKISDFIVSNSTWRSVW